MGSLKLKRIYQPADKADGRRVLVDGIWPRGVSKRDARIDQWLKAIAPSAELRRWFGHAPERWEEFKARYFEELENNPEIVSGLKDEIDQGTVTLLYGARDERHNNAVALREYLTQSIRKKRRPTKVSAGRRKRER